MISKLKKLEAKLSFLDVEDLFTLTIFSSDITVIRYLQKFIAQYSEYFNINEIFRDNFSKKQSFISVLIQRLYETTQWMRSTYFPSSSTSESPYIMSLSIVLKAHEEYHTEFFVKRKGQLSLVFTSFFDFDVKSLSYLQYLRDTSNLLPRSY